MTESAEAALDMLLVAARKGGLSDGDAQFAEHRIRLAMRHARRPATLGDRLDATALERISRHVMSPETVHGDRGTAPDDADFCGTDDPPAGRCHNYYEVDAGKWCHVCLGQVRPKWSGVACPCGHTWYCA